MSRSLKAVRSLFLLLCVAMTQYLQCRLTVNAKHDPYPVFSTMDPHDFLYRYTRQDLKGYEPYRSAAEKLSFSCAYFRQTSCLGKDHKNIDTELGDIVGSLGNDFGGKWAMIGLLMGSVPEGKSLPAILTTAKTNLFPSAPLSTPLTDPKLIDDRRQFGFFSFPTTYRKHGARFAVQGQILHDIGFSLELGVADICQTVTQIDNLTVNDNPSCPSGLAVEDVNKYLMCELKTIAKEIGLDICDFHDTSIEDVHFNLYWRRAFEINNTREEWPLFLLTPFVAIGFTGASAKKKDPMKAFALSFGNNEHNALGVDMGINFDFAETIEIGFHIGATHFFNRSFSNVFVPNHECQHGIYPFKTNVKVEPGHNWHFGLKMGAYHFLDRLSMYFEYSIVHHEKDKIKILESCKTLCADTAFKPEVLEKRSDWKVMVANAGFNYDISPNYSLGILWQIPLSQRNAYKNLTTMIGFNAVF